ncbi:MAG: hypothetical protein FJW30_05980 [Acidobacteria bacterium]|nr:hypothetical protein [Acidobacteriota bacterium]
MPASAGLTGPPKTKIRLAEFVDRFQSSLIVENVYFSYVLSGVTFGGEEMREYVTDPVKAIPPGVLKLIGKVALFFVPYLERPSPPKRNGKADDFNTAECLITLEPPERTVNLPAAYLAPSKPHEAHALVFGVTDMDSSDYHYNFYYSIASLIFLAEPEATLAGYRNILREELKGRVHGEVDEPGWKAKLNLLNKESGIRGDTKLFREYARHSFIDTLTLYLHGICCDIDVEPGPRQIASRHLRKRLQYLQGQYAPPKGYAVFPDEIKN